MNRRTFIHGVWVTLLLGWVLPLMLPAQTLVEVEQRTQILDGLDRIVNNARHAADLPPAPRSPFMAPVALPDEPVASELPADAPPAAVAAPAPAPVRLTDEVALATIARQFRPVGSLVTGNLAVLRLPGGNTIRKGDSFTARIHDTVYEVFVHDVSESGYALRLGSAVLQRSFHER